MVSRKKRALNFNRSSHIISLGGHVKFWIDIKFTNSDDLYIVPGLFDYFTSPVILEQMLMYTDDRHKSEYNSPHGPLNQVG